ncbi:hypothetical protein PM10SUCC1_20850 [Propionigenium maris DSM 9537]|uniref:Uncharacterized protein n=1 Tax=Propionigenium maris DSM 9537 TaxID=1123000 RepID=A0A9W6GMS3_9FUSO|nr:hypothetical protein [Propionigenium maris]GLI56571.1 hypothetical protein PM10SUCC1_20850 [Propionigenium maris DSM 9537]
MSREEIIEEIFKRFKLDSKAIKKMEEYEYKLIYRVFSEVPPEDIDKAIEAYKKNEFKIRVIRTTYH